MFPLFFWRRQDPIVRQPITIDHPQQSILPPTSVRGAVAQAPSPPAGPGHVSPSPELREELLRALRENRDRQRPIHMLAGDTSFVPTDEETVADLGIEDQVVVNAIKSVPVHY